MQSPVFKSFYSTVLKAQAKNLTRTALCSLHTLNKIQSVGQANLLVDSPARSFADKYQFEKVSGFESLLSRLAAATTTNDLLNLVSNNILLFKNDHLVLALRVLARIIRNTPGNEIEKLATDERYLKLTEKAKESVELLNEYEILDFLFWIRRFKMSRIPTNIPDETFDKLITRIRGYVQSKSFNFRNLVNLFFDLTYLRKNSDDIISEILAELKNDPKLLTPFTAVQILQAASRKDQKTSPKAYGLADFITKQISTNLSEFDGDQKCQLFKHIAELEMELNPPRFRVPQIMYTLKNQLKEALDQLTEVSVLNIIQAYNYLPKEFPGDLLEEIKEMVLLTIEHNSVNIKSFFLLDFLDKIMNLRRNRKLTDDKLGLVYEEIAKRLPSDDFLTRHKSIDTLLRIYKESHIKNENLLAAVHKHFSDFQQPYFSVQNFDILNRNGFDINPLLEKSLNTEASKNLQGMQAMRTYALLASLKDNQKFAGLEEQLKKQILDNPEEYSKYLTPVHNMQVYSQKSFETLNTLRDQLEKKWGNMSDFQFFRDMLTATKNYDSKVKFFEFIEKNKDVFKPEHVSRFFDAFFSLDEYTGEQAAIFERFLRLNPELINFKKLQYNMKDAKPLYKELTRNDAIANKVLYTLGGLAAHHKKEIKLTPCFTIIKRLETAGAKLGRSSLFLKRVYELTKEDGANISIPIEILYAEYLIAKNSLRASDAKSLFDKLNRQEGNLSNKLFSYILLKSEEGAIPEEEITKEVTTRLDQLKQSLTETNAKNVLQNLTTILTFPTKYLIPDKDLYLKSFKDYIGFGNVQIYTSIFSQLQKKYVRNNFGFYSPFFRELINNYNSYNKKMNASDLTLILRKASDFNIRNPSIYNYILADIGKMFNAVRNEDKIDIIESFARVGIKQPDLFDKVITRASEIPQQFSGLIAQLFTALYKVGYESEYLKQNFTEFLEKFRHVNATALGNGILYASILGMTPEQEKTLLEKYVPIYLEKQAVSSRNSIPLSFYDFLKYVHKEHPEWAEKFKSLKTDFDKNYEKLHKADSTQALRSKALLKDYLKAMKVEVQEDFSIDGYKVDLYIPDKKIIVKVLTNSDINFDRFTMRGQSLIAKRVYDSFEGYKAVFINGNEFYNFNDHMNRVNLLISNGIESQNTSGTYDFSHIKLETKETKETAEVEVPAEEAEKVEVEEEEVEVAAEEEEPKKH
jgi:hypothetical protein